MMQSMVLWLIKSLMTKVFYKKIALIIIDDGIGKIVKRTDNDIDDKIHSAVVEALRK